MATLTRLLKDKNGNIVLPQTNAVLVLTESGNVQEALTSLTQQVNIALNRYVGSYESLEALNIAHPAGESGQWAIVDIESKNPKRYDWDDTDNEWSLTGGINGIQLVNGKSGDSVTLVGSDINATISVEETPTTKTLTQWLQSLKNDLNSLTADNINATVNEETKSVNDFLQNLHDSSFETIIDLKEETNFIPFLESGKKQAFIIKSGTTGYPFKTVFAFGLSYLIQIPAGSADPSKKKGYTPYYYEIWIHNSSLGYALLQSSDAYGFDNSEDIKLEVTTSGTFSQNERLKISLSDSFLTRITNLETNKVEQGDIDTSINNHNTDGTSHSDIREQIDTSVLNGTLNYLPEGTDILDLVLDSDNFGKIFYLDPNIVYPNEPFNGLWLNNFNLKAARKITIFGRPTFNDIILNYQTELAVQGKIALFEHEIVYSNLHTIYNLSTNQFNIQSHSDYFADLSSVGNPDIWKLGNFPTTQINTNKSLISRANDLSINEDWLNEQLKIEEKYPEEVTLSDYNKLVKRGGDLVFTNAFLDWVDEVPLEEGYIFQRYNNETITINQDKDLEYLSDEFRSMGDIQDFIDSNEYGMAGFSKGNLFFEAKDEFGRNVFVGSPNLTTEIYAIDNGDGTISQTTTFNFKAMVEGIYTDLYNIAVFERTFERDSFNVLSQISFFNYNTLPIFTDFPGLFEFKVSFIYGKSERDFFLYTGEGMRLEEKEIAYRSDANDFVLNEIDLTLTQLDWSTGELVFNTVGTDLEGLDLTNYVLDIQRSLLSKDIYIKTKTADTITFETDNEPVADVFVKLKYQRKNI